MNWKLIFMLSIIGLAMGFLTVSPMNMAVENSIWGAICLFNGFIIARFCSEKYFLTGFLVSMVNCVWVTGAHLLFFHDYINNHTEMVKSMNWFHLNGTHPRIGMLLTGPIIGASFGIVIGLLALLFSKIMKKKPVASAA